MLSGFNGTFVQYVVNCEVPVKFVVTINPAQNALVVSARTANTDDGTEEFRRIDG